MEIVIHNVNPNTCRVDKVPSDRAFWWDGNLAMTCKAHEGEQRSIKLLGSGHIHRVDGSTLVTMEPDAEIHIGLHPAEKKLKKLINEKAKCVKMLTELRRDIENQLRPYSRKAEIISLLEEMEADDEQD